MSRYLPSLAWGLLVVCTTSCNTASDEPVDTGVAPMLDAGVDADSARPDAADAAAEPCQYPTFGTAEAVAVAGYDGVLMEPFVTRDGEFLFFNNSNEPTVDTNLHMARRAGDAFEYIGELPGANTAELDGVPSMDATGSFYFVSLRSLGTSTATVWQGTFDGSALVDVAIVPGVSKGLPLWLNFDAEISADGDSLYFVDGLWDVDAARWTSADLAIATRAGGEFSRLAESDALLAEVNSTVWEYAPATTPDELELYFTRWDLDAGTPPENWVTTRRSVDEPFCPPVRIVEMPGFVEASTLSPDGSWVYYHLKTGDEIRLYRVARSAP